MSQDIQNGEPLVIMHVEDDQAHALLVKRSLSDHQVANTIVHVTDGEAALDYLYQRGEYDDPSKNPLPDLILLDLRLPKIDGLEVLKEIRSSKELNKLVVVVLTTSANEVDVAKAYEHHANSYLVKPVDFQKFALLMKDLGFYWLGWNQYPW